jgi:hypothetical protein
MYSKLLSNKYYLIHAKMNGNNYLSDPENLNTRSLSNMLQYCTGQHVLWCFLPNTPASVCLCVCLSHRALSESLVLCYSVKYSEAMFN